MRTLLRRCIIAGWLVLLAACAPPPPLPTIIPTPPPASPTPPPAATATRLSIPTPEPTAMLPARQAEDPAQQAFVRVIHAAAGATPLDVYIDGLNYAGGLEYGQYTEAGGLAAGTYTVSVVPAGGRLPDGALVRQTLTIAGQETKLLTVTGTRAALALSVITPDTAPIEGAQSRLTLLNALPGTAGLSLVREDDSAVIAPVDYGQSAPVTLPAGFYTLRALVGGNTLLTLPRQFEPRTVYTLILSGNPVPEGVQSILIASQVGGIASVRFIQALRDSSLNDIYLDDLLLSSALGGSAASEPLKIPAGSYSVRAFPTGADPATDVPRVGTQWTFAPDETVSLILAGDPGAERFLIAREDVRPTAPGEVRILFVNALPGSRRVELSTEFTSGIALSYGQISDPFTFPATTVSFNWESAEPGSERVLLEFANNVPLQAGNTYLYIFAGRDPENYILYSTFTGIAVTADTLEPIATLSPASRLRFVNGVPGSFLTLRVDDVPAVVDAAYSRENVLPILAGGERVLTVLDGAGQLLARAVTPLAAGSIYSAYITGDDLNGYTLSILTDPAITPGPTPLLRLVNVSREATRFGASIMMPSAALAAAGLDGTQRPSLAVDMRPFFNPVEAGSSSPFRAFAGAGARDVLLTDPDNALLLTGVFGVTLENGSVYEVVAYQQVGSQRVTAFVSPYSLR